MALRIKGRPLAVYYTSYRANPFIIHPSTTPLTNSVSIYPLKVSSECRHYSPLKNERIFPTPNGKRRILPQAPQKKRQRSTHQTRRDDASENLVNGVGGGEECLYNGMAHNISPGLLIGILRYPSISRGLDGLLERTLSVLSVRIHRSYPSEGQRLSDLDVLLRLISQQRQYCETLSFLVSMRRTRSEQSPMIRRCRYSVLCPNTLW